MAIIFYKYVLIKHEAVGFCLICVVILLKTEVLQIMTSEDCLGKNTKQCQKSNQDTQWQNVIYIII